MLKTTGNETPVSQTARKRNKHNEAKFFEDAEKIIANAQLNNLKIKRDIAYEARLVNHMD